MVKTIVDQISNLLDKLNSVSIKRLFIYAILLYPFAIMHYYKDELSLVFSNYYANEVKIESLAKVQENCFRLKIQYNAAAVLLYIYQPNDRFKHYKERVVASGSSDYTPMEKMRIIPLSAHTRISESLRVNNYEIITKDSGHKESSIVRSNELDQIIITPIKDFASNQIIGEMVWVFKNKLALNITPDILSQEGQIFAYNIK